MVTEARFSQLAREVLESADAPVHFSGFVRETLYGLNTPVRFSGLAREALQSGSAHVHFSSFVRETLYSSPNSGAAAIAGHGVVAAVGYSSAAAAATIAGSGALAAVGVNNHASAAVATIAGHGDLQAVAVATTNFVIYFPPPANPTIQHTIGAYLYVQYNDDDDMQSFVAAYNAYSQAYLDWFNTILLPIYPNGTISGSLLDWVALGLYGIARPGLPTEGTAGKGPFNTYALNSLPFNGSVPAVTQAYYATSDDTFKRIITWLFYKGDGRVFSVRWLKRRIARFLNGINGTDYNIDQTYDISVTFTGPQAVTIEVPTSAQAVILQAAIDAGVLELPFQIVWTVNLV